MGPRALLELLRVGNAAMAAVGVAAGALVAGAGSGDAAPVLLAGLSAAAVAGAGNAFNDARDAAIDRRAHPHRPIPRGDATEGEARLVAGAGFVLGLLLAVPVSWPLAALAAGASLLLVVYELLLKERGLAGNAAIGVLVGALFLYGGVAAGDPGVAVGTLALLAGLSTLGREILKDAEDALADRGRRTLARTMGPGWAASAAAVALLGAVALSPLPAVVDPPLGAAYLPVVAVADVGFVAAAGQGFRSPGRAQRTAKASMGVALLGFLAGRLPGVAG